MSKTGEAPGGFTGLRDKLERALLDVALEDILAWLGMKPVPEGSEYRIRCPKQEIHTNGDANPSLRVSRKGLWHCPVCDLGGAGFGPLTRLVHQWTLDHARAELCDAFVHRVVPEDAIRACTETLLNTSRGQAVVQALKKMRGISEETIAAYRLGLDEETRVTIPIPGPYGWARDLRRWNALRLRGVPKNLPFAKGFSAAGIWWPESSMEKSEIFLCEGEPDTLCALSMGLTAVTVTDGAGAFQHADWSRILDKSLTVCMDRDDAGLGALTVIRDRGQGAARIRVLTVPAPHKDLGDWWLAAGETPIKEALESCSWEGTAGKIPVPLAQADHRSAVGCEIAIDAQVAGIQGQSYLVPAEFRVSCQRDQGELCSRCPNVEKNTRFRIAVTDSAFLDCLDMPQGRVQKILRSIAGVPENCDVTTEVLLHHNALRLYLIPGMTRSTRESQFVMREGIYAGNHVPPGMSARWLGYTRPDPHTQRGVTVLSRIIGELQPHQSYKLDPACRDELVAAYNGKDALECIKWNGDVLARFHTRIVGRELLHIAADLAYHSILDIPYGGKTEPGWLDVLVIGDTSTGKSRAVEGLSRLYDLGEIVSGKRCTVAGLIGGTIRHNRGYDIVPGAWALSDGGLCILDERMKPEVFSDLTRTRREGVAEFTHAGASQRMVARVRKIWIMNPPPGRSFEDWPNGAEVLREIVPAEEDVARWDLVVGVIRDVPIDDVVRAGEPLRNECPISTNALRAKVRWAWSRKPEHVRWTLAARKHVLDASKSLVDTFTSSIGLVQPGNTHAKVRKIAAAVASASWSTNDAEHLIVDAQHVDAARWIMDACLSSESLHLDRVARLERQVRRITNPNACLAPIRRLKGRARLTARRILAQRPSSRRSWEDIIPGIDGATAVETWLREGALTETNGVVSLGRGMADLLQAELAREPTENGPENRTDSD